MTRTAGLVPLRASRFPALDYLTLDLGIIVSANGLLLCRNLFWPGLISASGQLEENRNRRIVSIFILTILPLFKAGSKLSIER